MASSYHSQGVAEDHKGVESEVILRYSPFGYDLARADADAGMGNEFCRAVRATAKLPAILTCTHCIRGDGRIHQAAHAIVTRKGDFRLTP